ncbi:FliH/SctL family protein [uncultured Selenomonas sp.]|uniref:FliH/SctL family protein n=1 Tax=uncultured Selenomonas sp. TaxID=159275 RepID=UPI0028DC9715|nr:FliH/SctL family protein [uncultured Selenomonas sp.]
MSRIIRTTLWEEGARLIEPPPPPPKPKVLPKELEGVTEESLAERLEYVKEKESKAENLLEETRDKCAVMVQDAEYASKRSEMDARNLAEEIKEEAREAGREEGFKEGHKDGMKKAAEDCEDILAAANEKANSLMSAALEARKVYLQMAEDDITSIAMSAVEQILPQHFIDAPQIILPLVRKALMKVRDQAEVTVHVAPDAYEFVLMAQAEFQHMLEGQAVLLIQSDASLQPGDCVLETPNGNVDARLATQIELVKKAIRDVCL